MKIGENHGRNGLEVDFSSSQEPSFYPYSFFMEKKLARSSEGEKKREVKKIPGHTNEKCFL